MNFQPSYWVYNQSPQTFNTLNSFVLRGDAPPRMELTFDSLMARAEDEPNSYYGLVAETVDVSDDGNVYTFHLREGPRFHDGSPLTAEDVAFSLMLLKDKGHPDISQVIVPMAKAEATDPRTVDGDARRQADAADNLHHRRPADLLQGVLRQPALRFLLARRATGLRAPTGSVPSRRAASSNTSGSRTIGAPACQ